MATQAPPGFAPTATPPQRSRPPGSQTGIKIGATRTDPATGETATWTGTEWHVPTLREKRSAGAKAELPEFLHPVVDAADWITGPAPTLQKYATLGLSDEAAAAGSATASALKDVSNLEIPSWEKMKEAYTRGLEEERYETEEYAKRHPTGTIPLAIAGSLGAGGPAKSLLTKAPAALSYLERVLLGGKYGAGYGTVAGAAQAEGGPEERLKGAGLGTLLGGLTGGVIPAVAPVVGAAARPVLKLLFGSPSAEKAAASTAASIEPTVMTTTASKPVGWLLQKLRALPGAGGMIESRVAQTAQQAEAAANRLAQAAKGEVAMTQAEAQETANLINARLGAGEKPITADDVMMVQQQRISQVPTPAQAGEAVQEGLTSFAGKSRGGPPSQLSTSEARQIPLSATDFATKSGALYDRFDSLMPAGAEYSLPTTQNILRQLETPFGSSPQMSQVFSNSHLGKVLTALEAKPSMTFNDVKALRTRIGEGLQGNKELFPGVGRQELKALYAALTEDMTAAARSVGPQAERALQQANSFYLAGRNRLDELSRVMGVDLAPEQVYTRLVQAAQSGGKGDLSLLMAARRSLDPATWGTVRSAMLHEMGLGSAGTGKAGERVFNMATYLTNYARMSDDAKNIVFGMKDTPLRQQLQNAVKVFDDWKSFSRLANFSNTENLRTAGMWPVALFTAPKVAIPAAIAGNVYAKAATSPAFLNWLVNARGARTPEQIAGQIRLLRNLAVQIGWTQPELEAVLQNYAPFANEQQGTGTKPPSGYRPATPQAQPQPALQ